MTAVRPTRKLRDLLDVDVSALADGKVPVWRASSGKHEYEVVEGGVGGDGATHTTVTGHYTATTTGSETILVENTLDQRLISVPVATAVAAGTQKTITKASVRGTDVVVAVSNYPASTLGGVPFIRLSSPGDSITVVSDGTVWKILRRSVAAIKTVRPVEWWCAYDNPGDGTSPATPIGSLNAAIAAASGGDTIYMVGDMSGEAVVVDKAVRIVGLNNALGTSSAIYGPDATSTVMHIQSHGVVLENLQLRGGGSGINFTGIVLLVDHVSGCRFGSLSISGTTAGVPTSYPTSPDGGTGVGGCGIVLDNGEGHYFEQLTVGNCSIGLAIGHEASTNIVVRGRIGNCYQDIVAGLLTSDFVNEPLNPQPWAYGGGNGGGWTFIGVKDVNPVEIRDADTPVIDLIGDAGANTFINCDFSESANLQTMRIGSAANVFHRLVTAPATILRVDGSRNDFRSLRVLGGLTIVNGDYNIFDGGYSNGAFSGTGSHNRFSGINFTTSTDGPLALTGTDNTFDGTCTWQHSSGSAPALAGLGTRPKFVREEGVVELPYSPTITPDIRQGTYFIIEATNETAFTIANLIDSGNSATANLMQTKQVTFDLRNSSVGVMGTITWGSNYKLAGAITKPADGSLRTITFQIVNATTYIEVARSAADITI